MEEDTVPEGFAALGVDAAVAALLPQPLPIAVDSLRAALPPAPGTKEPGVMGCNTGQVIRVDADWPSAHKLPRLGTVGNWGVAFAQISKSTCNII